MHKCDTLATLNDTVAIQIDAGAGNFKLKPISYRVWSREKIAIWEDPDNANEPIVLCTVDRYDAQTRYRLWSDEEVWTGLTKKSTDTWNQGRVVQTWKKEEHSYGCLPFTLIHYHLPIESIEEVVGIGTYLWKAEIHIDNRLATMDEAIPKALSPILMAKGLPDGYKPIIEPGRLIFMPRSGAGPQPDGSYDPGEYATIEAVFTQLDIAGSWDDLSRFINQAMEAAEVPVSAVRMEQMGVASGISLMVEQEPLLKRAENRREMYNVYETDLARRTLMCVDGHYSG